MRKLAFIIIILSTGCFGQLWNGIIDPTRAVDWTGAGVTGGIPSGSWTQCVTAACNTVSAGGAGVTGLSISNAWASAPANTYVFIPAGTYTISDQCIQLVSGSGTLKANSALRGAGASLTTGTVLHFTTQNCPAQPSNFTTNLVVRASDSNNSNTGSQSNVANWTGTNGVSGTYTRFATSLTLSALTVGTHPPVIGTPLVLDQISDQTDPGGLYIGCVYPDGSPACYTGTATGGFQRGTNVATNRSQQQIVRVTSVSGTGPYTVGITPGIYAGNWLSSRTPQAWWSSFPVHNVGFENLTIQTFQPDANGWGATFFYNCDSCWAKGVSITGAGPFPPYNWAAIHFQVCNHCEVRDSYFYGNYVADTYVLSLTIASDFLSVNNIAQTPGLDPFYSADCEGCVSIYNFQVNPRYVSSNTWNNGASDYHAFNQFSLIEGNIGVGLYADSFHGTHDLNTLYRNRHAGRSQNCNNAGTGSGGTVAGCNLTDTHTAALTLNPGARYFNIIGNVFGTIGYHTQYMATPASHVNVDKSIITAGYYPNGPTNDSLPGPTSMFWGNWDSVTNAYRWNSSEVPTTGLPLGNAFSNAVPTSLCTAASPSSCPPSFYYSTQPSWWPATIPWPPIGPGVTGGTEGQCSSGLDVSTDVPSSANCRSGASVTAIGGGSVYATPAMKCYFDIMGGIATGFTSALSFDASLCYAAVTPTPTASLSWTGSPGPLNFGNIIIINTSSPSTITLTNTGSATLNISSIAITGDYAKTTTCGVTLAVSTSCTISVTFTPSVAGTRTGVVTVTDNSGGISGSTQTVNLTGNGTSTGAVTYASLPLNWVNNTVCNPPTGTYDQTIILDGATSTNNGPNLTSGVLGSKYPATLAGLKDAINNWRDNGANASCATRSACASPVDAWWLVKVPGGTSIHGSTYDSNSALVSLPGKSLSASSMVEVNKCLTIDSTTPLPGGVMACGRGLPGQGGARNPGCASPNDKASMWKLQMDTVPNAADVGINAGQDVQVSINYTNHVLVKNVEITEAPGSAQSKNGATSPSAFFKAGPNVFQTTPPTLPRSASHIGLVSFYIHGYDPGDALQSTGPTYAAATDASGQCLAWYNSGVVNIVNNGATATITLTSTTPNLAFGNSFFGPTFIAGSSINFGGTMSGAGSSITGGANYVIAAFDPTTSNTVLTVTTSGGLPATASGVNYLQVNPPSQYATGCGDDANNGVAFNVDYGWMMDGYIEKMHQFNGETHAASFGFDNGIEKIVNNWLEGGSESLFSGGAAVDKTGGPGSDNEIRRNYIGKDLGWRFLVGAAASSPNPPFGCGTFDGTASHNTCPFAWDVKNDFELKMGHRNLVDGNVIENSWADGQTGYCVLMNVEAASGGQAVGIFDPFTGLPNSYIDNIRFSNNWVRNCPQAIQTVNRGDMGPANGGGITLPVINVDHINNLFSNISDTNQFGSPGHNWQWTSGGGNWTCSMATAGSGPFTVTGNCLPYQTDLTNPAHVSNISVDASHNVTILHGAIRLDPTICQGTSAACIAAGQTVVTSGVTGLTAGAYAIANAGGTNWATDGTGGSQITYNDGASAAATLCTSVATCTTLLNPGVLTFASLGGKMTGMQVGDDVYATDLGGGDTTCSGHGYAVGLTGQHGLPGPATYAVSGTVTTGLTVVYQVNLTPTPGSATCLISNGAGFPKYVTVQNNTFLSPNIFAIQNFSQFWQPIGNLFFNNVFADNDPSPSVKSDVICSGSPSGEGTIAFGCWDSNTFQYYANVMMGRDSTKWSVVNCPSGATCPNSFPALTGSFPTGACSDGNAPYNCPLMALPWSSNFSLANVAAMSITSATQGVDVTQMSTAFTRNGYVCPLGANCGSTGPFPDFTPTSQNLIAPALNMVVQNRVPEVRGNP